MTHSHDPDDLVRHLHPDTPREVIDGLRSAVLEVEANQARTPNPDEWSDPEQLRLLAVILVLRSVDEHEAKHVFLTAMLGENAIECDGIEVGASIPMLLRVAAQLEGGGRT